MPVSPQKKIQHLYLRGGFGIEPKAIAGLQQLPPTEIVDQLFQSATVFKELEDITEKPDRSEWRKLSKEERREKRKHQRYLTRKLNTSWLKKMENDESQLREKMTLFWHGHFASINLLGIIAQDLNNTIRKHALGNFRELLVEVSKTPAILIFLNNQQNKKDHPNENFARELMELFTIGRGNYTENDVKEAARAFTGWGTNLLGQFVFRENVHDFGQKTFMGKTGNFKGEDIIDIILEQKETARFISRKLYKYFVNEQVNEQHVEELADNFYHSDYDITAVMKTLFKADWFYAEENIGSKIKSPVELLVQMNKAFKVEYETPESLILVQRLLGQVLFFPPNVSGWAGGKSWIDSSSLMLRLWLPSIILNSGLIAFEPKSDDDNVIMEMTRQKKIKSKVQERMRSNADWKYLEQSFGNKSDKDLAEFLLQQPLSNKKLELVKNEKSLKDKMIKLVSMPEYQLC